MTDDAEKRLDPTGDMDNEKPPEEVLEGAKQAAKDRWLAIFIQLSKSKRFKHYVLNNFDIIDNIDEETRTIETLVIEKPESVGPSLTSSQVQTMVTILKQYGCSSPTKAFSAIMAALGKGKVASIVPASMEDLQQIKDQDDAKKKLD